MWFSAHHHNNQQPKLRAWADKFGDDLKAVGQRVTNVGGLQQSYRAQNARVVNKSGPQLLQEIIDNLNKLIKKKVEAVQCLRKAAEDEAENFNFDESTLYNFTYTSMKLAGVLDPNRFTNVSFPEMNLKPDRHFYNIEVSLEESGIHVPTNVYDRYVKVAEDIQWSEGLNKMFIENYLSDPSLLFQYFGATTGVLRLYPAMEWRTGKVDLYDCRTRPWYIESATCSKDAIILMDNSGSMTGMRNTIAKLVVQRLLETFAVNDFINVFKFNWLPQPVLDCFNNTLVQATQENIQLLKDEVADVHPDGNASFPNAFTYAFNLLEKFREERKERGIPECNQAIMLVTDSLPGNITDVFERLNRDENGTIPVRVFTYLLGIEVIGVKEIQDVACENKGYYVHIHNLDEVSDQVLKYIPVVARPLVLQEEVHPISWTHVFADAEDPKLSQWLWDVMENQEQKERLKQHQILSQSRYYSREREDLEYVQFIEQIMEPDEKISFQEYNLMTSVAAPVFDRKGKQENETRRADLLGVVGVDVPLDELQSLMSPFKVGVNGYTFIVTNNGYLLLHPDLRPVYHGILKSNFHSVDLAEVEFTVDDEEEGRIFSEEILLLRDAMVERLTEDLESIEIKSHMEDFHRVYTERRNFTIAPIPRTPYSIGLVLPAEYGAFHIAVGDELNKIRMESPSKILEYFRDKNWTIHPEWTYCKYRYPSSHLFNTPEEELLHFLGKMMNVNFVWPPQFKPEDDVYDDEDDDDSDDESECSDRPEVDRDEYYCDRDLMQLLLWDAKVLANFEDILLPKTVRGIQPTLRFVATQSGLTRWQYLSPIEQESHFIQLLNKAIDEPWYRQAVLQHQIDRDSFVFSVPFNIDSDDDLQVTATQAVFPRDGGREAPASVIGFQFSYESFYEKFSSIVDANTDISCISSDISCYVLDHNGYILISEEDNDTSRFFGEVQSRVMEQLVTDQVYKELIIYDYQGICIEITNVGVNGTASYLKTPLDLVRGITEWLLLDVFWAIVQQMAYQFYNINIVQGYPPEEDVSLEEADDDDEYDDIEAEKPVAPEEPTTNIYEYFGPQYIRRTWPCDQYHNLYLLQPSVLEKTYHYSGFIDGPPEHWAKTIRHTNLIIVAVADTNSVEEEIPMKTGPFDYGNQTCHRFDINGLSKRRLTHCFTQHPEEHEIEACGVGNRLKVLFTIFLLTFVIIFC